ncbi:MAG: amidohydrolase family protein, partial [Bosea sp. (in: a-proteobacteria)]
MKRITADLSRRGFLAGLGALAASAALPGDALAQSAPATTVTLLTNVDVFTGSSLTVRKGMSVLVSGGRIAEVKAGRIAAPAGATVIDGGGRMLMPGLIDNHVHVFLSASTEKQLLDPAQTFEMMQERALAEAKAMLLRGFTAVRDVGGPVFPLKATIDKGAPGPRIWPSGGMIS